MLSKIESYNPQYFGVFFIDEKLYFRIVGQVSGLTDRTGAVSNSFHGFHIHQKVSIKISNVILSKVLRTKLNKQYNPMDVQLSTLGRVILETVAEMRVVISIPMAKLMDPRWTR